MAKVTKAELLHRVAQLTDELEECRANVDSLNEECQRRYHEVQHWHRLAYDARHAIGSMMDARRRYRAAEARLLKASRRLYSVPIPKPKKS